MRLKIGSFSNPKYPYRYYPVHVVDEQNRPICKIKATQAKFEFMADLTGDPYPLKWVDCKRCRNNVVWEYDKNGLITGYRYEKYRV